MRELTPFQELHHAVWVALCNAGEKECPVRVTRTTKRRMYVPDMDGFRIFLDSDPDYIPREQCSARRRFLCIGEARHRKRVIERYARALREAGFPVRVARDRWRKGRLRVWVQRLFDEYDNEIIETKDAEAKGDGHEGQDRERAGGA